MSAVVDGAVDVFYSFDDYGQSPTATGPDWQLVGGTSEASPLFSGIVAISDQAAGYRLGDLNPTLYSRAGGDLAGGLVDVTSGNNSFNGVTGFNALPGYDMASGLGTIDAAAFVGALAHAATTTTASAAPASSVFGSPVTLSASVSPTPTNDPFTPTGSVRFFLDGGATPVATVALTGGHASVVTSGLAVGPHTVTAAYGGDTRFLAGSSPAQAFTVTAPTTLTGSHPAALVVGPGATVLLSHASVGGSVTVKAGGSLDVEQSTIAGGLSASGGGSLRVCGSTVNGSVAVTSAAGFVLIGDVKDGCATNTIGGSLDLRSNHNGVQAIGNKVGGAVTNTGNSGAGPFPGDLGPQVSGNGPR